MAKVDPRAAVYTGSFDPITLGHLNVIQRCSRLVDRLIVGIGVNIEKEALFSVEDRMDLVRHSTAELKNIEELYPEKVVGIAMIKKEFCTLNQKFEVKLNDNNCLGEICNLPIN